MHGGPLHRQADHPALVVERVVYPLLLTALRGLGVVGARRVKDGCNQRGEICSFKKTSEGDKINSWKDIGPSGLDTIDCLGWRQGEWAKSRLRPNLPLKHRQKLPWNTCGLGGGAGLCVCQSHAPRQVRLMRSALRCLVNYRWEQTGQHGAAERGQEGETLSQRGQKRRGEAPSRARRQVWAAHAEHYLTLWTQSPVASSRGDAPGSSPESLTWWCTCSKHTKSSTPSINQAGLRPWSVWMERASMLGNDLIYNQFLVSW